MKPCDAPQAQKSQVSHSPALALWCWLPWALRGEFFVQKVAGQSGPRPPRWEPHAAVAGGLWGLCFLVLFESLPLELQFDPENLGNKDHVRSEVSVLDRPD